MKKSFYLKSRKTVTGAYWYYLTNQDKHYHTTGIVDDKTELSKEKAKQFVENLLLKDRKFNNINSEEINKYLFYNSCDGQLYWKIDFGSIKKGNIAGCITNNRVGIRIKGKTYSAHRLVWILHYGNIHKGMLIDHIDHNSLNNKIENLREVTVLENNLNRSKQKNNKSGCTGVCWSKAKNKWKAKITFKGKTKEIGFFENIEEAIQARKDAELKYDFHPNHGIQI